MMRLANVRLIFWRDLRDQLRDRRTLATVLALPLILYPIMGLAISRVTEFVRVHPARVVIDGRQELETLTPALLDGDTFHSDWFRSGRTELIEIVPWATPASHDEPDAAASPAATLPDHQTTLRRRLQDAIVSGRIDAAVLVPEGFAASLERLATRRSGVTPPDGPASNASSNESTSEPSPSEPSTARDTRDTSKADLAVPQITLLVNTTADRSRLAGERVDVILTRFRDAVVERVLTRQGLPMATIAPFEVARTDIAPPETTRIAFWSRILPFLLILWALTGAFYPAIDLVAGEKERGTLETLLAGPAERVEIVVGKLLTISVCSMAVAVLNLLSLMVTGLFVSRQFAALTPAGAEGGGLPFGPPPFASTVWLLVALPLLSVMFSSLALAIASFARGTKEGQYYLMPLILLTVPLLMISILPNVELDLGTSLIPVTGLTLWLKALMEGRALDAIRYTLPVLGMTLLVTTVGVRWAVAQFQKEGILFRDTERFALAPWLAQSLRRRGERPTFAAGVLGAVVLLTIRFFGSALMTPPATWRDFAVALLVTLVVMLAIPAVVMTVLLARRPLRTLRLTTFPIAATAAAALLAVLLHPAVQIAGELVQWLYPLSPQMLDALKGMQGLIADAPWWEILLIMAVAPAICEELAFRGFLLTSLSSGGRKWTALIVSALFFGATHSVLQQSLTATVVGVVLGYVVWQSRSIYPGIAYHAVHNGLGLTLGILAPRFGGPPTSLAWAVAPVTDPNGTLAYQYQPVWTLTAMLLAIGVLYAFRQLTKDQPDPLLLQDESTPSV